MKSRGQKIKPARSYWYCKCYLLIRGDCVAYSYRQQCFEELRVRVKAIDESSHTVGN